jgi:hypothetical protein
VAVIADPRTADKKSVVLGGTTLADGCGRGLWQTSGMTPGILDFVR